MRYLLLETDWAMIRLAHDLAATGLRVTTVDQFSDVDLFADAVAPNLIILPAPTAQSVSAIAPMRQFAPVACLTPSPSLEDRVHWLHGGYDAVLDARQDFAVIHSGLMAVARRGHGFAGPVLDFGPLQLELENRRILLNGKSLRLPPKIFDIFEYLALHLGQIVTREALMGHIYGLENEPNGRVFDVYIKSLRGALEPVKGHLKVRTLRGQGYRLEGELVQSELGSAA